ncbi:kinesin motor domain protein [Rhizoctonia solani]|uniref:Kinesin motor domain protein n=1 Tax=Rhizoctonia solani TaxID=456999 RepID=A0A8H8T4H4_9AGAM|nr:kinesin motor domain protein [Rhizoctonia solani]QRW27687.1 kinesin motor domain protein [Rhizoctonia solani]
MSMRRAAFGRFAGAQSSEAARREQMKPVSCWEKQWVLPTGSLPDSEFKVLKWVKVDKAQEFSDDELEEDAPLVPILDIPETADDDDEDTGTPTRGLGDSRISSEQPADPTETESDPQSPVPSALPTRGPRKPTRYPCHSSQKTTQPMHSHPLTLTPRCPRQLITLQTPPMPSLGNSFPEQDDVSLGLGLMDQGAEDVLMGMNDPDIAQIAQQHIIEDAPAFGTPPAEDGILMQNAVLEDGKLVEDTGVDMILQFRPPNSLEIREGGEIVVSFDDNLQTVKVRSASQGQGPEKDGFTFDRVFPMGTKQHEVFDYGVRGIVKDVINGYNGTVFAYGQTGSGKTFTMMGADIDSDDLKGIIPRITEQIFTSIVESDAHLEYLVKVSYMEIYLERIRDLLAPHNDNLQVHEEKNKGVYVKNLSDYYVSNAKEVYEIMRQGGQARVVTATNMNAESSRSHSIFLITIQQKNIETGAMKTGNLYLVDLAGSEKVGKTGASGQTLEEAKKINKSLSALGMVINALTDGKSSHIPYRDSKLTRILQESLGGNSRTTLVINCSPSSYNETETLSTLRFGMRAKSIKNTARVNAELSPAELKGLLKKAQAANSTGRPIGLGTSGEVRASNLPGAGPPAAGAGKRAPVSPPPTGTSRSMTPINPTIESLRGVIDSRPQTPTVLGLEKDEREEFLKRENELTDQLAEKETTLSAQDKLLKEIREELAFLREQEATSSKENRSLSTELSNLRLDNERLAFDLKELEINHEQATEKNKELVKENDELRAEKMALMMAQYDTGAISEKDEQLRAMVTKLDGIDSAEGVSSLSYDDIQSIRRQLVDAQNAAHDAIERLHQVQHENEMIVRRRDEVEQKLATVEADYEDLFGKFYSPSFQVAKLEAQYAAKREAHATELNELKQQLEQKSNDIRLMNNTVETLKGVNDELKRAFAATSAGIEGGKDLAESAKDLERTRKGLTLQITEFEGLKKGLVRDLQNRCEKVVELEIQLDELKEQYNNVIRNSNSKTQQKKMAFLERNLEQLTLVQKQLVDQNSQLKKEVGIAERKLLARTERIQNLEALLQDADRRLAVQNQKFEEQLAAVKDRLEQARTTKTTTSITNFGRIAKPLRGGGGNAQSTSTPASGSFSASPLGRVQAEETSSSSKRASWFFKG